MSDAFADLWSSTGASKPAELPRKLGAMAAAAPMSTAQRKPQNDVFSMLAAAGSSSSVNARTSNPSQPTSLGGSASARPVQKANSTGFNTSGMGGGDVFSGLLSGSLSSGPSSNGANLTIAQRAALAAQEKQARAAHTKPSVHNAHASNAWAGLDALGGSSSITPSSKPATPSHDPLDDLGFGSFSSVPSSSQKFPAEDDDWLSGLAAKPPAAPTSKPKPSTTTSTAQSLLDWDEFESSPPAGPSVTQSTSQGDPLGDFDFGNREDGLLGNHSGDEDDILGDLGKPVEQLQVRRSERNTPSPQPPQSGQRSRAVSPPPHLLGQIVEMGFSVQQARIALAATDTGLDVQAAIENLLANGAASSPAPEQQEERRRRAQREPGHERYYGSDGEDDGLRQPQRRPAARPPQQQQQRPARERVEQNGTSPSSDSQRNLQEQADKFIAQASEIGLSMFSRANAFWKEGKERVQRVYEERAAAAAAAGAGSSRQGSADSSRNKARPKWMQDAPDDGHVPEDVKGGSAGRFEDFDDEEASQPSLPQRRQPPPRAKEPPQQPAESPASRFKTASLFADDAPSVYVSPFRRKTPSRAQSGASSSAPSPAAAPSRPTPPRAPSPVTLTQRTCVSASASAISASAQQKALGTEKFKLGQYGEAEAFYTAAITALPANHLLLVPLFNNRALTRLKTGDASGAIEDCTAVISLIGEGYHPAREAKVTREDEGAGVDLADGLVKAYRRRAEAYEGKEKWDLAKADWEFVAGSDFAGRARAEAVTGIGRCRRMINTDVDTGASTATAPPRPKPAVTKQAPRPKGRVPTPPSEALNRVQAQNRAAEAEDQQKYELKDVVDAKLGAWKAGKENNIRALIASLDTVLWPELGWQKVGIHELVSPSQVKIRYTKAIAKLHPDKLNVRNTTLEQRMIANGVFGTLNEAWNAFKP
ncbi:hypothetical protein BD309DRAFT_1008724 [Dichomitus squalens]|uniref:UBA domain-containing protein n=1 Tax=Dichomitus squalens (strain LYAD-421) TaxID=732165 RepID=R7T2C8_DICSQ|nr:uncharacterized protein DICSQDRAFT_154611 [Dichomitus squalens LYAD-421 SS1]EJF62200.1 hypothetical protein DICSQDRAFT_154611 [Dichomitus squalens LYAD-421 SS1]TBU45174.1 hypothetical protein BD309DRAFT_1008724 [Dichomitus squalens]